MSRSEWKLKAEWNRQEIILYSILIFSSGFSLGIFLGYR